MAICVKSLSTALTHASICRLQLTVNFSARYVALPPLVHIVDMCAEQSSGSSHRSSINRSRRQQKRVSCCSDSSTPFQCPFKQQGSPTTVRMDRFGSSIRRTKEALNTKVSTTSSNPSNSRRSASSSPRKRCALESAVSHTAERAFQNMGLIWQAFSLSHFITCRARDYFQTRLISHCQFYYH